MNGHISSERREKPQFAFLGDSITDPAHIGCTANYWEFLADDLGVTPLVYGVNGHQMKHLAEQAAKFAAEHPEGESPAQIKAESTEEQPVPEEEKPQE